MRQPAVLLATMYSALMGCSQDTDSGKAAESSSLVASALEAQVSALPCSPIEAVDTLAQRFFPAVTLIRGSCIREHGDTISRIAGVDSSGVVYTLDSPSAFRWLVSRHPPANVDANEVGTYGVLALMLMGHVDARARVVRSAGDLPSEVAAAISPEQARNIPSAVSQSSRDLARLTVTTFDGLRLIFHEITVSPKTGIVSSLDALMWEAKLIH